MAGGDSGSETRARPVASETRARPVASETRARLRVRGGVVEDIGGSMAREASTALPLKPSLVVTGMGSASVAPTPVASASPKEGATAVATPVVAIPAISATTTTDF